MFIYSYFSLSGESNRKIISKIQFFEAILLYKLACRVISTASISYFNLGQLYFEGRSNVIPMNKKLSFFYFKRCCPERLMHDECIDNNAL